MRFFLFFIIGLPALLTSLEDFPIEQHLPNYSIIKLSDESPSCLQHYVPEGFKYDLVGSDANRTMFYRRSMLGAETLTRTFAPKDMSFQEFFDSFKKMQLSIMGDQIDVMSEDSEGKDGVVRKELLLSGIFYDFNDNGDIEKFEDFKQTVLITFIQCKGSDKVFVVSHAIKFPSSESSDIHNQNLFDRMKNSMREHVIVSDKMIEPKNWMKTDLMNRLPLPKELAPAMNVELFEESNKRLRVILPEDTVFLFESFEGTGFQVGKGGVDSCLLLASIFPSDFSLKEFSKGYLSTLSTEGLSKKMSLKFPTKDGFSVGEITSERTIDFESEGLKKVLSIYQIFQGERGFLVIISSKAYPKDISSKETKKAFSEMSGSLRYEVMHSEYPLQISEQSKDLS